MSNSDYTDFKQGSDEFYFYENEPIFNYQPNLDQKSKLSTSPTYTRETTVAIILSSIIECFQKPN